MSVSVQVSIQLPHGVDISDDCRHLLLGLLKRDPEERISFDEFLSHPFVDLEHRPCPEALQKAVNIAGYYVDNLLNILNSSCWNEYLLVYLFVILIINFDIFILLAIFRSCSD